MSRGEKPAEWQPVELLITGGLWLPGRQAPYEIGAAFTPYFKIMASTIMRRMMKRSRRFMTVFSL
jgi:hypothetical protein